MTEKWIVAKVFMKVNNKIKNKRTVWCTFSAKTILINYLINSANKINQFFLFNRTSL